MPAGLLDGAEAAAGFAGLRRLTVLAPAARLLHNQLRCKPDAVGFQCVAIPLETLPLLRISD